MGFSVILMVACLGAAAPWTLSHGVIFIAAGLLMILSPATRRSPRHWACLGGIWVVMSMLSHLPTSFFLSSNHLQNLDQIGLNLAESTTPQPIDSAISLASMTMVGLIALWSMLQPVPGDRRMRIAVILMVSVSLVTAADWFIRTRGYAPSHLSDFGFFPNRNHGATFVSMGMVVSLGILIQSLHQKRHRTSAVSLVCLAWLAASLILRSQSRSSLILIPLAIGIWYCLVDKSRYLHGNVGKAALLLLAALLLGFATTGGPLKQRLKWYTPPTAAEAHPDGQPPRANVAGTAAEGRIAISRDTLKMIASMPLTGCGAGQFPFVFPQFNYWSQDSLGSEVLHPESSWLWIAAECGVPACMAVGALVISVFASGARLLKRDHCHYQALRSACLAAASIPFLHGFFDVPLHRMGILWFATLLVGLALPDQPRSPNHLARMSWRLAGVLVTILGITLLKSHLVGTPLPHREHSRLLFESAYATYARETQAGAPPAPSTPDPLERALLELKSAVELTPMDSRAQGLLGMIALHFDDQDELARRAFATQRALNPNWVELPAIQGSAWSKINPIETAGLWREAMRRADRMSRFHPDRDYQANLIRQFESKAGTDRELQEAVHSALRACSP